MQFLDKAEVFSALCKATNSYGLLLSWPENDDMDWEGILQAAPYLSAQQHLQFLSDGGGVILSSFQEEIEKLYEQTVGDDGPTKANSYMGPVRVYALTCGPDGKFLNENT